MLVDARHPPGGGGSPREKGGNNTEPFPGARTVPHNLEAEQALLGALMVNNAALDQVSGFLEPHHFYDPLHGRIYDAASRLFNTGRLASPLTLKTWFEQDEGLAALGGTKYFGQLAAMAATVINAGQYGRLIYNLGLRRELIDVGQAIYSAAFDASIDTEPVEQIEAAEQALYAVTSRSRHEGGFRTFREPLKDAVDMAAAAYERDGHLSGIATGLKDLDQKMGGMQSSDLIIVAGRPSMGKTSLATTIAFNAARAHRTETDEAGHTKTVNGAIVGFFSLEMSSEQLATRILAERAGISSDKIRRGQISKDEFHRIADASTELQALPLHIDQTGALPVSTLSSRARRLKREHGLDLIIVDYLQLATGTTRRSSENRVQEVSEITQTLKALAKELDIPVVALSQLSRQVESRDNKRPQLSDLRESGAIEQDADVVLFLYRESYYLGLSEPQIGTEEHGKWQQKMDDVHGLAEIIIGKQRHGPTGKVEIQFREGVTRFGDYARGDRIPEEIPTAADDRIPDDVF